MNKAAIVETIDDKYMILVNGFQWGLKTDIPDRSGAYDRTFDSISDAVEAWELQGNSINSIKVGK